LYLHEDVGENRWFLEMRKNIYKKHKNLKVDHIEEEYDVEEK
jgi:hypothetical protein